MTDDEQKAYYPYANRDGFYHKSEADKVISELQKQVHDYAQGLYMLQSRAEKEARHQKYKRCLAIAKLCGYAYATEGRDSFWLKWWTRWLELAKNFKEAK